MVDLWALRILVTVADHGSFSSAAKHLHLTQPAVSRQVAALEQQLNVALFRRHARGVVPTAVAESAVDMARGVLARIDAFEATMRTFAGLDAGRLRIAGFASVNTHLIPEAIRSFDAAHPGVTVTLEQIGAFDALAAVRDGRIDLALVTDWQLVADPVAARNNPDADALAADQIDDLELVALLDEELHIALGSGHRLAGRAPIPLAELSNERWVDGAPPDCLGPLAPLTAALGTSPQIRFMCDDWSGKQALVATGAGIMVVPALAAAALRRDVVVRRTEPALPTRRLYAVTPRPPFRTAPAEAMLDLLSGLATETTASSHVDSRFDAR